MRLAKRIDPDKQILWSITLLLVMFWLVDFIVRQLPAPLPTQWTRGVVDQLYLSCSPDALWHRPWTIVTYTLLHNSGLHLLLNLLLLWLFGEMLLRLSGWRQFVWSYLGGAVVGGGAFVLFTTLLRTGGVLLLGLPLVGASASVIALVGYMVGAAPREEMPLPLIGSLRVWQVGLFVFLLLLLAYGGYNVGGLIAHLAGVLWGCGLGLFQRRRQRTTRQQATLQDAQTARYRQLLEKVQQSGYQSLSDEERKQLIDHNNQWLDSSDHN